MDTDEFNRKLGEYGFGDQPEVDSAQPKQVLATVAALGQPGSEEATNQSDPQPSHQGSPMSRERPRRDSSSEELLSAEEMVARAVLNKPITPGDAADPEALEATRKEMLATSKKLADAEAALREERAEAAGLVDQFDRQDREIAATLEHVKSMAQEWEVKMTYAQAEADRIVREAIPPRRINFGTPAEQQPLETPKDNMLKAAELLKKKDEEVDINYLRKLVASAMQQQSKADTSRRLESNPDNCVSTAQKDARANRHPDDESHTGSSERRRRTREHPNPIPVPSKTPSSDPRKGKDAMYSGRDKYRNPSPPPNAPLSGSYQQSHQPHHRGGAKGRSRKLRHYFQEHPVTVVSKAPLSTILNNADATGRTAKWGIELSAFDIAHKPRTAVKSQVLADFVADWTEAPDANLEPEPETWVMHFDGSKQHQGSGAGVTLKSPTGEEQYVLQIHFEATNNMAEYEALLHGLRIAKEIGIKHIICCGDSDLVAQQVAGTWNAEIPSWRPTETVDEIAKCFLTKSRDLVLRRQVKDHKLQSPWEGPFVVSKVLHNGSYYLVDFRELKDRPANWHRKRKREDPDDIYDETDRPWNIAQLHPFYT
ncbi:hypothetical protein QYE76_034685 [Lolium multiflorum]|uniref:RNase H type-1 domain-containing protein n=1 Tax=Lolium multiflorum TaxID=4521 RepID=A0AAD8VKF9_LOLMU|nr:hypothetical protein QYE76_034685 [Lolium multiflorum]